MTGLVKRNLGKYITLVVIVERGFSEEIFLLFRIMPGKMAGNF